MSNICNSNKDRLALSPTIQCEVHCGCSRSRADDGVASATLIRHRLTPFTLTWQLLDYESCNSYTFSVEVSNPFVDPRYLKKGPFKDQATVRVMVLNADEPPQFSQTRYHLDVSENCPPVCSVGRVHAVDPDTGQSSNIRCRFKLLLTSSPPPGSVSQLSLTLTPAPFVCGRYSIDPQSDPEALFRIASDTGSISTVMELDREEEQWHNITVIGTQRGASQAHQSPRAPPWRRSTEMGVQ